MPARVPVPPTKKPRLSSLQTNDPSTDRALQDVGEAIRRLETATPAASTTAAPVASGGSGLEVNTTNGDVVTVTPGMPIATTSGSGKRAANGSLALSLVVGLVIAATGPTLPLALLAFGPMTLTTAVWDAITGQVGGLTPDAAYYVGATGMLSIVAPSAPGSIVSQVGIAVDATTLFVNPKTPLLL